MSYDLKKNARLDRRLLLGMSGALILSGSRAWSQTQAGVESRSANQGIVNVRDFGAKGDGVTIDSPAINAAIEQASAYGGGTVWVPAGTYASYTIRLKNHITLHLDQGAVLLAAPTPIEGMVGGYDTPDSVPDSYASFQDYGHSHWRNALIWGDGLNDVAIVGEGLIWGKGLGRGHNYDADMPISGQPGVGDKAIALKNCRNVLLRDFKILQGGWFGLLATACTNMTIDNLLIDTNRDGMDIDGCRNVRITNCTVNSPWDDAICLKSSYALGYPLPCENITISDCYVSGSYQIGSVLDATLKPFPPAPKSTHGRIKFGTESNGTFKYITITNCVFDTCRGLAIETVDGALIEDVTISNITMKNVTTAPIFLRLGRRMRGPKGSVPGTLKRVLINNITSSGAAQMPSIIAGVDGYMVEDIRLSNLFLDQIGGADAAMAALDPPPNEAGYPEPNMFGDLPASGFFIRHARNIVLNHIDITTRKSDARPAFWLQDVDGFDASEIKVPPGLAFDLRRVQNFRTVGNTHLPDRRFKRLVTTRI